MILLASPEDDRDYPYAVKDYPGMSAEKRAKCRAIGEDIYWADVVKRSNDDRGYSRLAAAEAFEKCMES